jgi:hypothetical protein
MFDVVCLHTHPTTHVSASMATNPTYAMASSVTEALHPVFSALHAVFAAFAPRIVLPTHCHAGKGKNHQESEHYGSF